MDKKKMWYESKTVWAIIILILLLSKQYLDIDISESEVETILEQGTTLVATIFALYGRVVASKKIS